MATIRKEGELNLRDLYKVYIREGGILSYNKYKEVISAFNKEIVNKIIKTGWEFKIPYHCGLLKVMRVPRTVSIKEDGTIKGAIDWGNSDKVKANMIAEGRLPLVNVLDDNGKVISNNGGEPWLCYHTSPYFYSWVWVAHINMKNCLRYKFVVTSPNSVALSKSITENSSILFKLVKRDGNNTNYIRRILDTASTK